MDNTKQTAPERLDAIGPEIIMEQVAEAVFYQDIADQSGVSRGALMRWLTKHEDLYAPAREARAHKLAEDMLSIADETNHDVVVGDDGVERTNHEVVARSRLRVDTRKWLASKMLPSIYGDKVAVGGDANAPPIKIQDATPLDSARRIAMALAAGMAQIEDKNG